MRQQKKHATRLRWVSEFYLRVNCEGTVKSTAEAHREGSTVKEKPLRLLRAIQWAVQMRAKQMSHGKMSKQFIYLNLTESKEAEELKRCVDASVRLGDAALKRKTVA